MTASGKVDVKMNSLEFSIGPTIHINVKFSAGFGYRWPMPLGGTTKETGNANVDGSVYSMHHPESLRTQRPIRLPVGL